jgi:hypothetical protein
MENIAQKGIFPLDIMSRANGQTGLRFSTLITDNQLLIKYGGLTNVVSNLYKLMALQ